MITQHRALHTLIERLTVRINPHRPREKGILRVDWFDKRTIGKGDEVPVHRLPIAEGDDHGSEASSTEVTPQDRDRRSHKKGRFEDTYYEPEEDDGPTHAACVKGTHTSRLLAFKLVSMTDPRTPRNMFRTAKRSWRYQRPTIWFCVEVLTPPSLNRSRSGINDSLDGW